MAVSDNLTRYRTLSTLGSGGMAVVQLAEDELLGRQVALKRLSTEDVRGLSRLRREALLGASISHPNLVSIYDVISTEDGGLVIVMEYVPGETLGERLTREGKLAAAETLRTLDGVAAGLDAIHEQGIVHRDVKPPNILLGHGDTVKLADLGIASAADRTRITSAGTMLGSFRYMAPEQLNDGPITPAIDVYALSAVAFEALSGQKARREDNPMALAHAISTLPPPDLRQSWHNAPPAAAEVLKRGLAINPRQRPASAGELVRRLREAFEPQTTAGIPPTVVRQPTAPTKRAVPAARPLVPLERPRRAPAPPTRRPTRAAAAPPPTADPNRDRSRNIALAALLVLVAAGVAAAVLLSSSSGSSTKARTASAAGPTHRTSHHATSTATKSAAGTSATGGGTAASAGGTGAAASTSAAAAPAAGPAAASTSAGSPTAAVQNFYELAAAHRYADAWALADPVFRSQLGGYTSFQAGQAGDRSITFTSLRTVSQSANSATVALTTTSVRTSGTQHCQGTADLAGSGSMWLVHQIHINCA